MLKIRIYAVMLLAVMLQGCKPVLPPNIPDVPFDVTISLFDYPDLQGVGGSAYVEGGSRGLVIYRVSLEQFNAYERHCPYPSDDGCGRVTLDENGLYLVDDDCFGDGCGSRFNVINGEYVDGPSSYSLYQYNTSYDGGVLVRVFNN